MRKKGKCKVATYDDIHRWAMQHHYTLTAVSPRAPCLRVQNPRWVVVSCAGLRNGEADACDQTGSRGSTKEEEEEKKRSIWCTLFRSVNARPFALGGGNQETQLALLSAVPVDQKEKKEKKTKQLMLLWKERSHPKRTPTRHTLSSRSPALSLGSQRRRDPMRSNDKDFNSPSQKNNRNHNPTQLIHF